MSLTLHLPDHTFDDQRYLGIKTGALLNILIATDLLAEEAFDDAAGWFSMAQGPLTPVLAQVAGARYAFAGRVRQSFAWEEEDLSITYLLLDTPTPITLLASNFDDVPVAIAEGEWLYGIANLKLVWEDALDVPIGQPLQAVVQDIQRLFLRPGPGFGLMQSVASLPPEPFGPDQVLLVLRSKR